MHITLNDGMSNDFEVHPGINLNLKVKLKDRQLPLTITFPDNDQRKDLVVYTSSEFKEPREGQHHGAFNNVSYYYMLISLAHKNKNNQHDDAQAGWVQ